ncbi:MAG: chromosomal replication initiator protein DnaA [Ignavibacteria bacterium]
MTILNPKNERERDAFSESDVNDTKASEIWSKFLEIVKLNVSELKLNTWFKPITPKSFNNNTLLIKVPSRDYYEMIISRFGSIVTKALKNILGDNGKLIYEIDKASDYHGFAESTSQSEGDGNGHLRPAGEQHNTTTYMPDGTVTQDTGTSGRQYLPGRLICNLNSEYTFENFVKGKSNEFATAAALSISHKPGAQYNPLMVYGGVGLGKTHLIQAIGNYLNINQPETKVMYISGPEFTTSFVQSIRANRAHEFERFYKSLDILIVDDIQFLEGKESTQDSFFQIFNSLYQLKRQIVLSCDKPPHQLEGLEERLITRFQWGLTVDIQPPDLETRIAILNKKCEKENVTVPYEVLEFVALNIKDNIRSLEGCLKSMIFDSELTRSPVDMDTARRTVVKFGVLKNRKQNLDISTIIAVVSKYFDIDESLLRLKSKRQEIVTARHTAMYLSKELTTCSLQTIGAHFGGRNHATVIHACKCIEDNITKDTSFAEKLEQLKEILLTS